MSPEYWYILGVAVSFCGTTFYVGLTDDDLDMMRVVISCLLWPLAAPALAMYFVGATIRRLRKP